MANRFRKRSQADADLDSIWSYIAADNIRTADGVINRIERDLRDARQNPLAGRATLGLGRHMRSFPIGSYVIFYIPVSDGIEVVRVMSGRQDIDADDMSSAQADAACRDPPTTRSSRWIISARPLMPRIAITSGEERPLIFSASSAS